MIRFIVPILLIGISIGGFFTFLTPKYDEIVLLKKEVATYNNALDNSVALEKERDKIVKKYDDIKKVNLDKIQKMLPDSIDNIRLILEIQELASPYGMALKDVKYDTAKKLESTEKDVVQAGVQNDEVNSEYGIWNLEFTTVGSYSNFIDLTKNIEKNLRLVDISSVSFSSNTGIEASSKKPIDHYAYTFKIKTYWLKN